MSSSPSAIGLGVCCSEKVEQWMFEALNGWQLKEKARFFVEMHCSGVSQGGFEGKNRRIFEDKPNSFVVFRNTVQLTSSLWCVRNRKLSSSIIGRLCFIGFRGRGFLAPFPLHCLFFFCSMKVFLIKNIYFVSVNQYPSFFFPLIFK